MSEELDTHQKLEDASAALCAWMRSQGFSPADGVMLAEWFIARLIVENQQGPLDIEDKLSLNENTIRQFIAIIQKAPNAANS